jgi:hypothetical protein
MLKKGPELKLSELKVPGFLQDVYYDLRDRHLLPLVVLLMVAVVAVPILLGKGGDFETTPPAIAPEAGGAEAHLIVAKSTPGLRVYKRRFEGRVAHNPFKQQFTEKGGGGGSGTPREATFESSESSGSESASGSSSESTPTESSSGGGESESGGAPAEEPERSHLTYYSWAVDVSVVSGTGKEKSEPVVHRNEPEYTSFPSNKVPALTFIGVTKDEKKAVMLVSDKVIGLFGEAVCVRGTEHCQLLALEPNFPVTVVYGADSRTYRIELRKIRLVTTDSLNQAPLGKNKGGKGKGKKSGEEAEGSSALIAPRSAEVGVDQRAAGQ